MFIQNFLNNEDQLHFDYDHMVYVRLFEGCNLNCEHCYIPNNPKKIDTSFYENNGLTETLIKEANIKEGSKLYLQWHGGEPTMLGVKYLEDAINNVEKDKRFIYQHGIQTNLINFSENTDQWLALYRKYFNSHVGISWDFAIRHVKRAIKNEETNKIFEEKFWENVKLAQKNGIDLYMVITVTKLFFEKFKNPFDFFEFISEKGIKTLNFERITNTGEARETWQKLGLSNQEYSRNMSKFFKAYVTFKNANPEIKLNISPFDGLLESVIRLVKNNNPSLEQQSNVWDILSYKNQGYGCWSGTCDTRFHTIDSNGYKHGCTALTSEQDNKNKLLTKNLNNKKVIWIGGTPTEQKNNIINTRQDRQKSCEGCEFLKICSSGCLAVEKWDESGECSGAKQLFKTIKNSVISTKRI